MSCSSGPERDSSRFMSMWRSSDRVEMRPRYGLRGLAVAKSRITKATYLRAICAIFCSLLQPTMPISAPNGSRRWVRYRFTADAGALAFTAWSRRLRAVLAAACLLMAALAARSAVCPGPPHGLTPTSARTAVLASIPTGRFCSRRLFLPSAPVYYRLLCSACSRLCPTESREEPCKRGWNRLCGISGSRRMAAPGLPAFFPQRSASPAFSPLWTSCCGGRHSLRSTASRSFRGGGFTSPTRFRTSSRSG